MIIRARHARLLAVPFAVSGFALAGTVLVAAMQPDSWNPVVDPLAPASVTEIDGAEALDTPASRGGRLVYAFPTQVSFKKERVDPTADPILAPPVRIDGELGIPQIVLEAYRSAETTLADRDPSCHLQWQVLAGVGRVESGHARDGLVYADGTTFEPILGPQLDGNGFAAIPDTDDGLYDGDVVWDRAVGPMQFIPGTWRSVGIDGNGDGKEDPHNVFDAALAAGIYLCAGSSDLGDRAGLTAALLRYNHSDEYVAVVMAWIDGYLAGQVTPLPPRDPPPPGETTTPPSGTTSPPSGPPTSPPTTPPTSTTVPASTPVLGPPTSTASSTSTATETTSSTSSTSSSSSSQTTTGTGR